MKCTDINTHSDDYLDGELSLEQQQLFEQHLAGCKHCATMISGLQNILQGLKRLPVVEPSADFETRVFKEVRKLHPTREKRHFVAGFATAMAAGFALWFVSTLFVVQQQSLDMPDVMTVALNESQNVRLLFDAPSDIDRVTLSLGLPGNVEISGYPGQSELIWETSLSKGQNVLSLPVMAIQKGSGELVAELSYGDKVKVFRLVLKTADDGVMNYQLQPVTTV